MDFHAMDRIHIRDLKLSTVIGVNPEERDIRQELVFNITLYGDQLAASESDDLARTINYDALSRRITEFVENTSFELIETLAQAVADLILSDPGVAGCCIVLDKPGAVTNARSVAVEIFRSRS